MTRVYEPCLAVEIADRLGTSPAFARRILAEIKDVLKDHLENGDSVRLTAFGTFALKNVGAKTLKNPRTGRPIRVQPHKCPAFRPAASLKERIRKCAEARS